MQRNEILESGQRVLLYRNGLWHGKSDGLGKLLKRNKKRSNEEWWGVVLDDGEETNWSMLSTDKELRALDDSEFWHGDYYMRPLRR